MPSPNTPANIEMGSGLKPKSRNIYPFHKLKKKGDYFVWPRKQDDHSLRVQASRQKRVKRINFTVRRTPKGILVCHMGRVRNSKTK